MNIFGVTLEEEWRDVVGFEGYYQVSNLGRVASLPRQLDCGNYVRHYNWKLRTQSFETGYALVELHRDKNQKKMCLVHRLVAEAFIPNPSNLPQVNHIDGNKLNNNVKNLEWCTQQENNRHAIKTGLVHTKPVRCIENGIIFAYGGLAEKELNLPPGSVYRSIYESCKVFDQYTFEYVNPQDYVREPNQKLESRGKAVICIETGIRYKDSKTAERELGLYETAVYNSIYQGRPVKGYSFKFEKDDSYVHQPQTCVSHKPGKDVKVKCIETGLEFNSYAHAARETGISESSVANSVRQHRSVKGMTFVEIF